MQEAKDVFQIRSPSAKMRDEVGVMLSRGIAEGIFAGSSYIENALAETGRRTERKFRIAGVFLFFGN